jgi:putative transposase
MSNLASLSEAARTIALDRFRILQPHLEQERFLTQVARDARIPYRTAQRWVMHYRKYALIGLTRDEREDSGSRRALSPTLKDVTPNVSPCARRFAGD